MDFATIQKIAAKEWGSREKVELSPAPLQVKIASRNWGVIDPENICHYIAGGGYSGLARALSLTPRELVEEIEVSGLRGRRGSGSRVSDRWRLYQSPSSRASCVVCNATEVDPQAASIRALLEGDPHAVLEGILVTAYAVGANLAVLQLPADAPLGIQRMRTALQRAGELGLVGEAVLGSAFGCRIELREVGRALGGADLAEGVEALPAGPVCVHGAETMAHVAAILEKGGRWYAGIGDPQVPGTKLVTLAGVARPGVFEVPMGISVQNLVMELGGGASEGNGIKSVRIGGPAGGFVTGADLDFPYHFLGLSEKGAAVGSGSLTVLGECDCLVELARSSASLIKSQSCGRCVFCREGISQINAIVTDFTTGKGKGDDPELLLEIAQGMRIGSLCGVGKTAAGPIVTGIANFREEFEAHIKRKRCPALVCRKYISFHILAEKCLGCGLCLENCSDEAIAGEDGMVHVIDQDECTRCGACLKVCPTEGAVVKAGAVKPKTPDEPIPVGSWKRRG